MLLSHFNSGSEWDPRLRLHPLLSHLIHAYNWAPTLPIPRVLSLAATLRRQPMLHTLDLQVLRRTAPLMRQPTLPRQAHGCCHWLQLCGGADAAHSTGSRVLSRKIERAADPKNWGRPGVACRRSRGRMKTGPGRVCAGALEGVKMSENVHFEVAQKCSKQEFKGPTGGGHTRPARGRLEAPQGGFLYSPHTARGRPATGGFRYAAS